MVDIDYDSNGRIPPQALPGMDVETTTVQVEKEDEACRSTEVLRCNNVQKIDVRLRRNPKKNLRFTDQDYTHTREAAAASKNVTTKKRRSISSPDIDGGMHACPECGKQFEKKKALHGHLRCHPERSWRGSIYPPTAAERKETIRTSGPERQLAGAPRKKFKAALPRLNVGSRELNFESEVEPEGAVEHTRRRTAEETAAALDNESDTESIETLYKANVDPALIWNRKIIRKYFQRSKTLADDTIQIVTKRDAVPVMTSTEDKEVLKAASELMMLSTNSRELQGSQGSGFDGKRCELEPARIAEEMQEKTYSSFDHERKRDRPFQKWKTGKRSRPFVQRETPKAAAVPFITPAEIKLLDENIMFLASTACALEESEGKLLDGIRRSPKLTVVPEKIQNKASSATQGDESDKRQEGNEEMINGNRTKNTSKEHVCNICDRVFNTGPALGGHMRRHYRKAGVNVSVSLPEFPLNLAQQMGATDFRFSNEQSAVVTPHLGDTGGGQGEVFKSKIIHQRNSCKDRKKLSQRRNKESRPANEELILPTAQLIRMIGMALEGRPWKNKEENRGLSVVPPRS